jgi:hypothetical protein
MILLLNFIVIYYLIFEMVISYLIGGQKYMVVKLVYKDKLFIAIQTLQVTH